MGKKRRLPPGPYPHAAAHLRHLLEQKTYIRRVVVRQQLNRATICVPTSLSHQVGAALGAQAGEARLREVITAGGFRSVRRAAETPFNMILEARP
jgi:hypothetical protein